MSIGQLTEIAINEIHADQEWNCRGKIFPIDLADLIRSIDNNGLQAPILIRPYNSQKIGEIAQLTGERYNYGIVSGFRRFYACKALKWTTIPCVIKEGISDVTARILNLEENLKRQNLNIVQEANTLKKLQELGLNRDQISNKLGMSRGWVDIRMMVLDLEPEIQEVCEQGLLNQSQIRSIYGLPTNERYEVIRTIKTKKIKGEKNITIKRPTVTESKRARTKHEISLMNEHILEHIGQSFATRVLAWASGEVTSLDIFVEIQSQMSDLGKEYEIPEHELS